ncbi:hypothetical protein [Erwinia amylovora]|uniref:hypothetical protein n=1 Tax=Erwinia amylovora TaxID=552 RepID=UPI003CFCEA2B
MDIRDHMTSFPFDTLIKETHLGQAHLAGTGPKGTTCRECVFWHKWERRKASVVPCAPGYFGKKHKTHPGELKTAYCNRPILNKATRLIPHHAKSCRLFEQSDTALPAIKPEA